MLKHIWFYISETYSHVLPSQQVIPSPRWVKVEMFCVYGEKWLKWLMRGRISRLYNMRSLACSDSRLFSQILISVHCSFFWSNNRILFPFPIFSSPSNERVCRNFRKHLRMVGSRRMKAQSESPRVHVSECLMERMIDFICALFICDSCFGMSRVWDCVCMIRMLCTYGLQLGMRSRVCMSR